MDSRTALTPQPALLITHPFLTLSFYTPGYGPSRLDHLEVVGRRLLGSGRLVRHQHRVVLLEGVRRERPLLDAREREAHRVEGGVVERRAHRLLRRRPLTHDPLGAVGQHHLLLVAHEVLAREHELEERRRESAEHLRVGRVRLRREAHRVAAQVPVDDARRRVRLAAHAPPHLGEAARQPLVVRLPARCAAAVATVAAPRAVELHVREDDQVRHLVRLERRPLRRREDQLARRLEVGRAAPWRRLQRLHLVEHLGRAAQVDPTRRALEGDCALREGRVRQLSDHEAEADRRLHRRAHHRARHVDERHELAQVDRLRQARAQRRHRLEAGARAARRLEHRCLARRGRRRHRLAHTAEHRLPLCVHQVGLEDGERRAPRHALLRHLVREELLPLDGLGALGQKRLAQVLPRRHAALVVRVAVARRLLRRRQLALECLVEEGLALALQAERSHPRELDLLPSPRRHQHLGRVQRLVERPDQLPVLARGRRCVRATEELGGELARELALRALVEVAALTRSVLPRERQVGRALCCGRRLELSSIRLELVGKHRQAALGDGLGHAGHLGKEEEVLPVAKVRNERQRRQHSLNRQLGEHLVEQELLSLAHAASRTRVEREDDEVGE
mmetsp:Transcript_16798/g.34010  ORF Transcript_16798/g.34010 Transcript_16798/m.34010 type:complete len:621 (+) Transcript_16798:56-1918(+)